MKFVLVVAIALVSTSAFAAKRIPTNGEGPDGFASTYEHRTGKKAVDSNKDGQINGAEVDVNDNRNNSGSGSASGGSNR